MNANFGMLYKNRRHYYSRFSAPGRVVNFIDDPLLKFLLDGSQFPWLINNRIIKKLDRAFRVIKADRFLLDRVKTILVLSHDRHAIVPIKERVNFLFEIINTR